MKLQKIENSNKFKSVNKQHKVKLETVMSLTDKEKSLIIPYYKEYLSNKIDFSNLLLVL